MHLDAAAVGNLLAAAGLLVTILAGIIRQSGQMARLSEQITALRGEMLRHCAREERTLAEIHERLAYLERHRNGAE